jgi:uncharacterized protein YegJ (DUF2314 family)
MKSTTLAVGLTLFAALRTAEAFAQEPLLSFAEDDPLMNAAIADAKETLPLFLANALNSDGTSIPDALLKVGLPTVNGTNTLEHIWLMPFAQLTDTEFTGVLANEPVELGDLRIGDSVKVTIDQVSDWSLTSPKGLYWGNYTTRVMFDHGAFGDDPFETVFEASPLPPDWQSAAAEDPPKKSNP